jgi:hypothetical protein
MSVFQEDPPTFARSPEDALQMYCDWVAIHRKFCRLGEQEPPWRPSSLPKPWATAADRQDEEDFARMPVYYWADGLAHVVLDASRSYPLDGQEASPKISEVARAYRMGTPVSPPPGYVPRVSRAFCVFTAPVLEIEMVNRHRVPLSALAWSVGVAVRHDAIWLRLRGYVWHHGVCAPVWWSDGDMARLPNPEEQSGMIGEGIDWQTFAVERVALAKWVCSAATFLEQQLVNHEAQPVARHCRKRAQAIGHEGTVHVVTLRKQIHPSTGADLEHPDEVPWSCRWLVRGHWRQQWFPARATHAPMWIHPYIKGPEDKPFRQPKETVYAVMR